METYLFTEKVGSRELEITAEIKKLLRALEKQTTVGSKMESTIHLISDLVEEMETIVKK